MPCLLNRQAWQLNFLKIPLSSFWAFHVPLAIAGSFVMEIGHRLQSFANPL